MTVAFARLHKVVSNYMVIDIPTPAYQFVLTACVCGQNTNYHRNFLPFSVIRGHSAR